METQQINNLPVYPPKQKKSKSKRPWLIILVLLVLIGGTFLYFNYKDNFFANKKIKNADQGLAGFSKLVISPANAMDNFILEPTKSDSIGVDSKTTYVLKSKESLDLAMIKENLKLEPEIDYSVKEISDKEWEIVPEEGLEANSLIKASLAASYMDDEGEQKQNDYSWVFQVKDSFKVINSIPRDLATGVPVNSGIEFTFSHDNYQDLDDYFLIEPSIKGRFERHSRTVVFVPNDNMEEGTIYTVKLKSELGLYGSDEILGEDYSFVFETAIAEEKSSYSKSYFRVYNYFLEHDSIDEPIIEIYARNMSDKKINTSVYSFSNFEEYFESVKRRDMLPWWSHSKDFYTEDVSSLNKLFSVDLDIQTADRASYLQLPDSLDTGFYLLELTGADNTYQVWLQISDLATYYNVTKTDTIFWVNSIQTGAPVNNVNIEILDTNFNYQTNVQGVAKFTVPDIVFEEALDKKENQRKYFKLSSGRDSLLLPASPITYRYSWSAYGSDAQDYWSYLYTDRPMYQTTDKINYWGLLKDRADKKINEEIKVTLYKQGYVDYYYRPVYIAEQKVKLANDGTFSGEIDVSNLRPDSYVLKLELGDKLIRTKYINIKSYTKPAYSISITPEKNNLFVDEVAKMKVRASFFEGTPVPNLALKFKMPEGEYKFVTDENGEADLTYEVDYTECQRDYNCWPRRVYLTVLPEDSELAEISANTTLRFYGPNIYLSNKISYPEAGLARVEINSKYLDLEAMVSNNWWQRNNGDDPAPNTKISGELIKIEHNKIETGTKYDFINKKTYKTYKYEQKETVEDNFVFYTDDDGNYVYEKSVEPNVSYRLKLKVFDDKGYYDNYTYSLYYYNGRNVRYYNYPGYSYYHLKVDDESNSFVLGQKVDLTFMDGEEAMPDRYNSYLYMQFQNGLQEYSIAGDSSYDFNFQKNDVPNVSVRGVYFNGRSYITSQPKQLKFDSEQKRLKISISTDKDKYEPGEKARLDFDVRDINDRPVRAAINVNLVDEAFYALVDEVASPLSTIYSSVSEGILSTKTTHVDLPNSWGANSVYAEKGCFAAGTEISMADGTKKSIEYIEVGDKIKTFSDFMSRDLVEGTVSEVWEHTISHYYLINNKLKVTPEHLVFSNGRFSDVASLKVGDWLLSDKGEKVFIETIEQRFELIKVYNFAVEPQHTYFADGFYVHNEKGGGPREFFVDTALFRIIRSNNAGKASVEFDLPDNITSWRVTAQAVSDDMHVGVATEKVPVSLPVFAEVTIGDEYLLGDEPIARMRSFGTALNSDDKANFFIQASSLDLEKSKEYSTQAFESAYFPLPDLKPGTHDIVYSLETDKGNDSILLPINVINSRVSAQQAKSEKLTPQTKVEAINELPFSVILTDQDQNQLYYPIVKLASGHGSRIDQLLAKEQARDLLTEYYDWTYSAQKNFNPFDYQLSSGGISLLTYSSEDLELSARVASLGYDQFDNESLSQYFYRILDNKDSNREEVSYALFGLASLKKPILPRLYSWLKREDLSAKEKLYLSIALYGLGDKYGSNNLYLEVMKEFAVEKKPHIQVKVSDNNDEVFHVTVLAATIASYLDAPESTNLWKFVDDNQVLYGSHKNSENLFNLERINYIKDAISKLKSSPAEVEYEFLGRNRHVKITGGLSHSFQVHPQHVDELKFKEIVGDVGIIMSYTVPIDVSNAEVDNDISIRREYYVDGKKTNTFNENDTIEVRLYPTFSDDAYNGDYQITDILPSGMMPVTKTVPRYYSGNTKSCHFRYPYNASGQTVKYRVSKYWRKNSYCGEYFTYYARVKNKGTYVAEPAIIQAFNNPDFINYSQQEKVVIK